MRERPEPSGLTVVELLVVVAIAAILATIAGLNYKSFSSKASVEKEIKSIYSDIMDVRQKALLEKRPRVIEFTETSFKAFSSGSVTGHPVLQRTLPHPITWSSSAAKLLISYDTWGCTNNMVSICIDGASADAAPVNCIKISRFMVRLGRRASTADPIVLE